MADGAVSAQRVAYAPELGWAICGRVAAGESLSAICREAGQPHRTTVREWAVAEPAFGQALAAGMRTARLASRLADRRALAARPTPWTPGRPSGYTPQKGAAICARLANGETLTAIGREPGGPCFATILNWVKRHPEFGDLYVQARQIQADYLFDEARDVGRGATPKSVWADRLRFDIIRWQTARLAPRKYCERLVAAGIAAEPADEGLTVIIKRFSDVTEEEEREADRYA